MCALLIWSHMKTQYSIKYIVVHLRVLIIQYFVENVLKLLMIIYNPTFGYMVISSVAETTLVPEKHYILTLNFL